MKERLLIVVWLAIAVAAPGLMLVADRITSESDVSTTSTPDPLHAVFNGPIQETPKRLADWFDANSPARLPAIRSDAYIDLHVFRDSPNQSVLLGREGWLFYRQSQSLACSNTADGAQVALTLAQAKDVMERLDRNIYFVIAPDKASIYPEYVSDAMKKICDRRQSTILEDAVTQLVPSAVGWEILKKAKADDPYLLYEPGDTHWTSRGSTLIVKALITNIDGSLWDQASITYDPHAIPKVSDLTELIGLPTDALPPHFSVGRAGVTTTQRRSEHLTEAITIVSTGGQTLDGSTLVIFDSFGRRLVDDLGPFFSSSTWLDWRTFDQDDDAAEQLAAALLSYDHIVVEVAERESYRRIGTTLRDAIQLIVANDD